MALATGCQETQCEFMDNRPMVIWELQGNIH